MTEFKKAGLARAEKKDIEDIKTDIEDAKTKLLNKQVQHSKTGNIYTVFGITTFVTTQNTMVHYRDIKTGIEWSRTINEFLSQDTIGGAKINKFVLTKGA